MSKKEKLLKKLKNRPRVFPWRDVVSLLSLLGFDMKESKRGSGVKFINTETKRIMILHKPHPEKDICPGAIDYLIESLEQEGLLK